ncbi:MAG: general secretion pathway protein GspK, partial [Planctomycetaceae bacterium]|nr:general secretion pathway protein GspK [Planctomycetaceae bacterium]
MKTYCNSGKRRGVILVIVLVVIVLSTLSVLAFSKFMMAERRGTDQSLRQKQARLLAESGVEYLRILLMKEQTVLLNLGGLYDNSTEFCGHLVTDGTVAMTGQYAGTQSGLQSEVDLRDVGRFSVLAPLLSNDDILTGEEIRYGIEDESCKANLRWVLQMEIQQPGYGQAMLLRMPGMTEEIADAILDWMDEDDEPREFGAENDYYAELDPPYYARNAIPDSLDELLLVKGVTPKLLYGIDWNRNNMIDYGEPEESTLDELGVSDGSLNLGLVSILTLDSRESMVTPDGLDKINVNMDDLEELRTLLEERFENQTWVDYIISYRQQPSTNTSNSGINTGGSSGLSGILAGVTGNSSSGNSTKINSILDLVASSNPQPSNPQSSNSRPSNSQLSGFQSSSTMSSLSGLQTSTSPFSNDPDEMNQYLPILYDNLMISDQPVVGRININQAPRTVLELLTAQEDALTDSALLLGSELDATSQFASSLGVGTSTSFSDIQTADIIEGILAERICDPSLIDQPEMNYPFWPYTHGIVTDWELMKKLEPYFCTQGAVFKANIVGRFDEQSPVVRLEVWLDASVAGKPAKIIRIRELTELGPGYSAEQLGADEWSRT